MKKMILLCMVLISMAQAKEIRMYSVTIEVKATKNSGVPWDFAGGAPDLSLYVNGVSFNDKNCKNKYRCTINFLSTSRYSWFFEVIDKDLYVNDLVTKGRCSLNTQCNLGNATLLIRDD